MINNTSSNDRSIQIYERSIEKFEKQVNNKQKTKPFEIFLNSLVDKQCQLHFESPTHCSRLLKLLSKTTLNDEQQIRILSFFREKGGLPEDVCNSNVQLLGKDGVSISCSKQLLETF